MKALAAKAREAVQEGCVLLRNEGGALPLEQGLRVALFGRTQLCESMSGLGSGGKVNIRERIGLYDALREDGRYELNEALRTAYERWEKDHPFDRGDGWARHPWCQEEMPLDDALLAQAAEASDVAVVLIGRNAGEDCDLGAVPGGWYLSAGEERLLEAVCGRFSRTVVLLNVCGILDMSWVERYAPKAVMVVWQGGQESGRGMVKLLAGDASPSGRLTDTVMRDIRACPANRWFGQGDRNDYEEDIYVGYRYWETFAREEVLYPFGAGLSYTDFQHEPLEASWSGGMLSLRHRVTNIGGRAGKEVVQAYAQAPQGRLGKPARALCGFAKTRLLAPGESEDVALAIPAARLASYDEASSCFVLEAGEYRMLVGHDVRLALEAGRFTLAEDQVVERLEQACAPVRPLRRMRPDAQGRASWEDAPMQRETAAERRHRDLPAEIPPTGDVGLRLTDVADGRATMDALIAQMTDEDLCCLVRGEGMSSPRVTPGTAAAFGGVSDRLTAWGLPAVCCADGPSGIRMDCGNKSFLLPSGTMQACTWNETLIQQLYDLEGLEMRKHQIDALLGPGMNIHRHPLNGRNFEYFSEDPLLTGRMACAQLRGLHGRGVTGVVKHFACNDQETKRRTVEAVVSERALREMDLRAFEIAVREGGARAIMTSYNPLNGNWTASHYDLLTTVLRKEWGFDGLVMTDWWAFGSDDGTEPSTRKVASMIRAQNDLFMVMNTPALNSGEDDSAESLREGRVTRAEYQRSAKNICRFILDTPAFARSRGIVTELDRELAACREAEGDVMLEIREALVDEEAVINGSTLDVSGGNSEVIQAKLSKRGVYRIELICRAAKHVIDTAQLPVSVFMDGQLLVSRTLSGMEHDWQVIACETPEIRRRLIFYMRFFFAEAGLEVQAVRIRRVKALE